jgi:hypothetical protein
LYYTNPCLNWFGRELSVVCRHISSIGDKLDRKGQQNSNFLVTHSIWMQFFFGKIIIFIGYWWTI